MIADLQQYLWLRRGRSGKGNPRPDSKIAVTLAMAPGGSPIDRTNRRMVQQRTILVKFWLTINHLMWALSVPIKLSSSCEQSCAYYFVRPAHTDLGPSPNLDFEAFLFTCLPEVYRWKTYRSPLGSRITGFLSCRFSLGRKGYHSGKKLPTLWTLFF